MNPEIIDRFLMAQDHPNILKATDEEIMNFTMSYRSFDWSKFQALLSENADWACVILAHIHLDHVLDVFFFDYCVRPKSISNKNRRLSLIDKTIFLHGVGVLSKETLVSMNKINKMRNKFAHELKFEVSEEELSKHRAEFYSIYGDRLYSRDEYLKSDCKNLSLKTLLKLAVAFLEEERLAFILMGMRNARAQEDLADAMRTAHKTLGYIIE